MMYIPLFVCGFIAGAFIATIFIIGFALIAGNKGNKK